MNAESEEQGEGSAEEDEGNDTLNFRDLLKAKTLHLNYRHRLSGRTGRRRKDWQARLDEAMQLLTVPRLPRMHVGFSVFGIDSTALPPLSTSKICHGRSK